MYVDLRKSPEVLALIKRSGCPYYHAYEAEITVFEGPVELTSCWDGGTKYFHAVVSLVDNRVMTVQENGTPWTPSTPVLEALPPGFALVTTCSFRSSSMPARIRLHPDNMTKYLPPAVELTADESAVLGLVCGLKSFARREEAAKRGITLERYEAATASLKGKKLLNAGGAVTPAGRNARPARDY